MDHELLRQSLSTILSTLDPGQYSAKDEYDLRVTWHQIQTWPERPHPCGDDYF